MAAAGQAEVVDAAQGEDVGAEAVLPPLALHLGGHVARGAAPRARVVLPPRVRSQQLRQTEVGELEAELGTAGGGGAGGHRQDVVRLETKQLASEYTTKSHLEVTMHDAPWLVLVEVFQR